MTMRWMYPPELERQRERDEFDPVVEGSHHDLTRELALAIWKQVCEAATDEKHRIDDPQARRRFHEIAARIAVRGGRLVPEVGKRTRVGIEIGGDRPSATSDIDELTSRVPGRTTLVAADAQHWPSRVPGRTTLVAVAAQRWESQAQAEFPVGERRLQAQIAALRHDRWALLAYLDGLPSWQRQAAQIQLIRALGPEQAAWLGFQAFGSAAAPPATPPELPSTDQVVPLAARLARLDGTALAEMLAKGLDVAAPELNEVVPGLLGAVERHVALCALSLLRREHRDDRRSVYDALDTAAGGAVGAFAAGCSSGRRPPTSPAGAALADAVHRRGATLWRQMELTGREEADPEHPTVHDALARRGSGQPLSPDLRAQVEARFGVSFGSVRIHADAVAARATAVLHARAFTLGEDIFFAEGAFVPGDASGWKLLIHELTHVVQGYQGRIHDGDANRVSRPTDALEIEAARSADHAALARPGLDAPQPVRTASGRSQILRNDDKDEDNKSYVFHVPIPPGEVSADEFLILTVMQAFRKDRPTAVKLIAQKNYKLGNWHDFNKQERDRGWGEVKLPVRMYEEVMGAGGNGKADGDTEAKAAAARAKGFEQLSADDKRKINGQTNKDFWDKTKYKPGQPLSSNDPKDKAQMELWRKLRDAVLANRERLETTDASLKRFLPSDIDPKDYPQVLGIIEKLKQLTPDELDLYDAIASRTTTDLSIFEKSLDAFIKYRLDFRKQIEEAAKAKQKEGLEQELDATWSGFDPNTLNNMSRDDKLALANKMAAEQRNKQLKHMVTHPGETAAGMVTSVVRVDKVAQGIGKDLSDMANGDNSAASRVAGALGAGGKLAGWLGGVAAILYVAILFIPGANLVEIAATIGAVALGAGVAGVVLSAAESKARLQAAADAKDGDEFRKQVDAAGSAEANFVANVAMIAAGIAIKLSARIKLPGRLQSVGNAFNLAKNTIAKGVKGSFSKVKGGLVEELRGQTKGVPEQIAAVEKAFAAETAAVEKMAPADLIDGLAKGDPKLVESTGITPEMAQGVQKAAAGPNGQAVAAKFHEAVVQVMKDASTKAVADTKKFVNNVENAASEVEKASTSEELDAAVKKGEDSLRSVEKPKDPNAVQAGDPSAAAPESGPAQSPRELAAAAAAVDEGAAKGLANLESMGFSKANLDAILAAVEPSQMAKFLRTLSDPGFNKTFKVEGYVDLTGEPAALDFAGKYGGKLLGKLWRRYYEMGKLAEAMDRVGKVIDAAPDKQAAIEDLFGKDSPGLDKKLGLAEPKAPPPPRATKKNMGVDRGSAEWKQIHEELKARAKADHPDFTPEQIAAWADMKQTVAVARRGKFAALEHKSKLKLLDSYDAAAKKAGVPQQFINGLRGDLAEWLFNPDRALPKSIFKDGVKLDANKEGATIPDYSTSETGGKEWVNQKSDLIDKGADRALDAAKEYRAAAEKEAGNLPKGEKYSLDFIRDPPPEVVQEMLEALYAAKGGKPSPIYRVKIGGKWYTRP